MKTLERPTTELSQANRIAYFEYYGVLPEDDRIEGEDVVENPDLPDYM